MLAHVIGGGWVTAGNWGRMRDGAKPVLAVGDPPLPPEQEIYADLPVRFRRFDSYCQLGCAAIALALKDAGMESAEGARPIGIIASTCYGCFETDLAFFDTAREEGGVYASPNLFAFTLPGIALSEAAIYFKLTGPTFTLGDPAGRKGYHALSLAFDLLASAACRTVLAGWVDGGNRRLKPNAPFDDGLRGAVFAVLTVEESSKPICTLTQKGSELLMEGGLRISSILDVVSFL